MSSTVKKLPHSQIELHFELDPVRLEVAREAAIESLSKNIKVPGFRPGKAPRKMLEEQVNPTAAMQTALDEVLNKAFQDVIREHNIVPVAQPQIDISSTDLTKPIEVTAVVQVRPEIEVGNWQKIKVAKESIAVDDKKIEETLQTVFERSTANDKPARKSGLVDAQGNPLTKDEPVASDKIMDDAWASTMGAKDLNDLRSQIASDLQSHAEYEAENTWQDTVLEQIIDLTKVDLPETFIEDELNRMRSQFEQQLTGLQVSLEKYLEQAGKTQEELEAQWRPQAIKQATMEVALAEIAKESKIDVSDADVEEELAKAEPEVRAQFADPQQRYYLSYSLWRQKVLKYILEEIGKNSEAVDKKKSS